MTDRDRVLGHADEADGIEEYDNRLPAWWLWLFYLTIAFAIVYTIHYHFIAHRSQAAAWDAEMAAAAARWPAPEGPVVANTPADIEAGRATFGTYCVACHGQALEGGIGPSLVDTTWIHGGSLAEITRTITQGVPEKGMVAWGPVLGPQKIAQVAAFVHSAGGGQ